jgi:hypothetical protein
MKPSVPHPCRDSKALNQSETLTPSPSNALAVINGRDDLRLCRDDTRLMMPHFVRTLLPARLPACPPALG